MEVVDMAVRLVDGILRINVGGIVGIQVTCRSSASMVQEWLSIQCMERTKLPKDWITEENDQCGPCM